MRVDAPLETLNTRDSSDTTAKIQAARPTQPLGRATNIYEQMHSLVLHLPIQSQPKARQARYCLRALVPERNLACGNRTAKGRGSALVLPLER